MGRFKQDLLPLINELNGFSFESKDHLLERLHEISPEQDYDLFQVPDGRIFLDRNDLYPIAQVGPDKKIVPYKDSSIGIDDLVKGQTPYHSNSVPHIPSPTSQTTSNSFFDFNFFGPSQTSIQAWSGNRHSMFGFTGNNSLYEVQRQDDYELQEIGGTYEAIAAQMENIVRQAELNGQHASKNNPVRYNDTIEIIGFDLDRGPQNCPFDHCGQEWYNNVIIRNVHSKRELVINMGTVHLARKHHLLEKGNKYGISAKEFYKEFM